MGHPVVTYVLAHNGEEADQINQRLRAYAERIGLDVKEQYVDAMGRIGDAITAMFRSMCADEHDGFGVLVTDTSAFGPIRMRRAILAAYRELDIPIYSADTGVVITWREPDPKPASITGALRSERTARMEQHERGHT